MNRLKRFFVLLPLMLAAFVAQAQTDGAASDASKSTMTFADRVFGVLNAGVGTKCNDVTPAMFNAKLGYRFVPRVYAFVHARGTLSKASKATVASEAMPAVLSSLTQ